MSGIIWIFFCILVGLLIFVRKHVEMILRYFKVEEGISPVVRVQYSLGALFLLILLVQFCRGSVSDNKQQQTQEWIAVFDIADSSGVSRAQFLMNDMVMQHQGVAVSLLQVERDTVMVIVPPTYDLLYFKLILDTLANVSNRLSASEVTSQIVKRAHAEPTSFVKTTLFTDRSDEYRTNKDLQIINIGAESLQKEVAEITPQITVEPIGFQGDVISFKGIQYVSLLLGTVALILCLQGFRPKSIFILMVCCVFGSLSPIQAQEWVSSIRNAEVFYLRGEYRESENILKNALKTESLDPYLLFNLALCQVAVGEYDTASDALTTIENRESNPVLDRLRPHIELLREFILYKQLQRAQERPDLDTLAALLEKGAALKPSSPLFQNWLMLSACQYRMQQRERNFSFQGVASVLFSRISQMLLAYQNDKTVHREYTEELIQEITAYIALCKSRFNSYSTDLQKLFIEPFALKSRYQMDEAIGQLDRIYLIALLLSCDSFEEGLRSIFAECIQGALWIKRSPQFQFIFEERREFLGALLKVVGVSADLLISSSNEYEKVYEDFQLAQLVLPMKNRFYNIIEAIFYGNISDSLLSRALKVIQVENQDRGNLLRLTTRIMREWVDSGFYPNPAIRNKVDGLLALSHPMSYEELKNSTLVPSLQLLIDLPKIDGSKRCGRLYLEKVLPYMQVVISHPYDQISANTLLHWEEGFENCLQQISFGDEGQHVQDLSESIKKTFQELQGLIGTQEKNPAFWNQQIALALEKMQSLYALLEDQKVVITPPQESIGYSQKSSLLFDPIQLYKTLELRDRQLREQN